MRKPCLAGRASPARAIRAATCLAALAAVAALSAQDENSAAMQKIDAYRSYSDSGFSYDFATKGDDGQSSLMRVSVRTKGGEAALVHYLEPVKQRGQAVLVRGNAFWLYEPGMKSALRISPRQILFGQASAGDVSRISFRSMYDVSARADTPDGVSFSLKAKVGAEATYDLVDLYATADFRPVKALCRGKSGTLMKTISYDKFEAVGDKTLLTEFTITDEINKKSEREKLSNFSRDVPPDSEFSVQALRFSK